MALFSPGVGVHRDEIIKLYFGAGLSTAHLYCMIIDLPVHYFSLQHLLFKFKL